MFEEQFLTKKRRVPRLWMKPNWHQVIRSQLFCHRVAGLELQKAPLMILRTLTINRAMLT